MPAAVDILQTDITDLIDVGKVEALLRDDALIGILVNDAGANTVGEWSSCVHLSRSTTGVCRSCC